MKTDLSALAERAEVAEKQAMYLSYLYAESYIPGHKTFRQTFIVKDSILYSLMRCLHSKLLYSILFLQFAYGILNVAIAILDCRAVAIKKL